MKRLAWFLALTVGFLSLSLEILWVRLLSFLQLGAPQAFGLVLGLFLLGVALGAALGKRACRDAQTAASSAAAVLAAAGLLDLCLPWLLMQTDPGRRTQVLAGALVLLTAALKAAVFPIAHHLGSNEAGEHVGRSLSKVYCMNILGSTMGPLLTGFVLLDYVSLSAGLRLVGVGCLAVASCVYLRRAPLLFAGGLAVAAIAAAGVGLHDDALIRRLAGDGVTRRVHHVIETRQGILYTTIDSDGIDSVFGGNAYDGRTNIDLSNNSNSIDRAYLLAALHPAPERVLVIGLSTGAWVRLVSAITSVREIDVVEINPGYLDLIGRYPALAPLLRDPRIHIHIDDGRRWLKRHPDQRYDLLVMNTTFHWRANVTNLLSREFMLRLRQAMAPGALLAFNATGSAEAFQTAHSVFAHAYRWSNFIYCAQFDFLPVDTAALAARMYGFRLENGALLDRAKPADAQAVRTLLGWDFVRIEQDARKSPHALEVITDNNLLTEYRYANKH